MKNFILSIGLLITLTSCSGVFYYPNNYYYGNPKDNYGLAYDDFFIKSRNGNEDSQKINLWHIYGKNPSTNKYREFASEKEKYLFVQFHGNAQNITAHYHSMVWLANSGHDVISFDYRGYGQNKGKPTQEGLNQDALAVLNHSYQKFKAGNYSKFIIVGQSLGGIVALRAFKDFKYKESIDLLVIDSSFPSYQDIAFQKLSSNFVTFLFSPLAYVLVSDKMAADKYLHGIENPTLVLHQKEDPVVPHEFGKKIFDDIQSKKKWFWSVEGRGHVRTFLIPEYREKLLKLISAN